MYVYNKGNKRKQIRYPGDMKYEIYTGEGAMGLLSEVVSSFPHF